MTTEASNLIAFLCAASEYTKIPQTFDERWSFFVSARYVILQERFPHETFSVEQCTYDFFQVTLDYLIGHQELPKREAGNVYKNNYIDWIIKWKKQMGA